VTGPGRLHRFETVQFILLTLRERFEHLGGPKLTHAPFTFPTVLELA